MASVLKEPPLTQPCHDLAIQVICPFSKPARLCSLFPCSGPVSPGCPASFQGLQDSEPACTLLSFCAQSPAVTDAGTALHTCSAAFPTSKQNRPRGILSSGLLLPPRLCLWLAGLSPRVSVLSPPTSGPQSWCCLSGLRIFLASASSLGSWDTGPVSSHMALLPPLTF